MGGALQKSNSYNLRIFVASNSNSGTGGHKLPAVMAESVAKEEWHREHERGLPSLLKSA